MYTNVQWYVLPSADCTQCRQDTSQAKQECSCALLPLGGSQDKTAEVRKLLIGHATGINWPALSTVKTCNHPYIFELSCQREQSVLRLTAIGRNLTKCTRIFAIFSIRITTLNGKILNCNWEHRVPAAGIWALTLDQYFSVNGRSLRSYNVAHRNKSWERW